MTELEEDATTGETSTTLTYYNFHGTVYHAQNSDTGGHQSDCPKIPSKETLEIMRAREAGAGDDSWYARHRKRAQESVKRQRWHDDDSPGQWIRDPILGPIWSKPCKRRDVDDESRQTTAQDSFEDPPDERIVSFYAERDAMDALKKLYAERMSSIMPGRLQVRYKILTECDLFHRAHPPSPTLYGGPDDGGAHAKFRSLRSLLAERHGNDCLLGLADPRSKKWRR